MIVAVAATTAFAAASGTIPAPGSVVEACYTNTGNPPGIHAVTIRNSASTCPKGTTALNWNQTGPAGPPGPSTAGPTGLDETYASAAGTGAAEAVCPASHPYAISGGGQVYDQTTQTVSAIGDSTPDNDSPSGAIVGWNIQAVDPTMEVNAIAICVK